MAFLTVVAIGFAFAVGFLAGYAWAKWRETVALRKAVSQLLPRSE